MDNSQDILKNMKYQKVKIMKLYSLSVNNPVLCDRDKLDILEDNA